MYFQKLEKLSKYDGFAIEDLSVFDSVLKKIYEKNYWQRFNPKVYKYFNIDLDEEKWIRALEKLESLDLLQINFEICCLECGETIEKYHNYSEIPFGNEAHCEINNTDFEITSEDIFVTYKFHQAFINNLSETKKKLK